MSIFSNRRIVEKELAKNPYIEINFKKLFETSDLRAKKILILGANQGYEAKFFLDRKANLVEGIDIFYPKRMYKHRKYSFLVAKSENLPFNDGTFDYVYSQAVLEHVSSVEQTLLESARVLKSGGLSMHIASPLWNSRDGHHRPDIFGEWPWCHVGRNKSDMQAWVLTQPKLRSNTENIFQVLEEIMDGISINQCKPQVYFNAVKGLEGVEILKNEFDSELVDPSKVSTELANRMPWDLSIEDLFKVTHTSIFRKT